MILLKFLAIPVVGASAVGTMSPLIYVRTTSSTFKTSWKGYLSTLSPVLQDCKTDDEKYYTVLLDYNPEGGAISAESSEVSFRVERTSGLWEKTKDKEIVWKAGTTGSGGLSKWGIQPDSSNNKTEFKLPDPAGSQWRGETRIVKAECKGENNFKFTRWTSQAVFANELTLTIADKNSCKSSFGYVECSITINPSDKLKWKEGSEPKVIYKAI